ncbi:hypothetical protein QF036_001958 [Arthrobacter globiformis]|nr:hypothetical protein [Arthrobacter globiformis]
MAGLAPGPSPTILWISGRGCTGCPLSEDYDRKRQNHDGDAPSQGGVAVVVGMAEGGYCQSVAIATFSNASPPTLWARPVEIGSPFLYLRRPMKARTPTTRATANLMPSLA